MNKITSALATGGLALAFAVGAQLPASAHTPTLVTNCGQLALQLTGYPAGSTTTAVVDGKPAWSATFGAEGFQDSVNFDPTVKHTWSIEVVSGDGDQQFDLHHVGESEAHCYAPPVEPPVDEPPVVVPPAPVTVVHVQDYVAKCDVTGRLAEFVFDNTGSTVDVPFTISDGTPAQVVTVKAGETARPQPYSIPASGATYTITAADKSWTFVVEADCPVVVTPPVVTPPVVTPPVDEPTDPATPVVDEPTEPTTPVVTTPVITTPVATTPVIDKPGALTPITVVERVEAKPTAAKADGSLAFTGPMEVGASLAAGLALLVAGIAVAVVARARRRA